MHFERFPWCEEARNGLLRTFNTDEDFIREGVTSGRMELFKVDGDSWAVVQTWDTIQMVWCYQGRNVLEFARAMYRIAQRNKLRCVRFFTKHRALPRMLKPLNPVEVEPQIYEIGVQANGQ